MIDLYTWSTPNGRKVSIFLEEAGLDYRVHPVDIGAGAQFAPDFLRISPNNKIPAIFDPDGPLTIFESGAILTYLGDKSGQFLPNTGEARAKTLEWLFWQVGGLGPMLGQLYHFRAPAQANEAYARNRFQTEVLRLLTVMNGRLAQAPFLAGPYSIADMACYPWMIAAAPHIEAIAPEDGFPAIRDWLARLGERPALQRGMKVPA